MSTVGMRKPQCSSRSTIRRWAHEDVYEPGSRVHSCTYASAQQAARGKWAIAKSDDGQIWPERSATSACGGLHPEIMAAGFLLRNNLPKDLDRASAPLASSVSCQLLARADTWSGAVFEEGPSPRAQGRQRWYARGSVLRWQHSCERRRLRAMLKRHRLEASSSAQELAVARLQGEDMYLVSAAARRRPDRTSPSGHP